jgi:hypothetical protein
VQGESDRYPYGAKHHRGQGKLRGAKTKDGRTHGPKPDGSELEPDHEEQHHDAERPELKDAFDIAKPEIRTKHERTDDHARGEIAEHGAHAQEPAKRRGNGGGRKKYRHLDQSSMHHGQHPRCVALVTTPRTRLARQPSTLRAARIAPCLHWP